MYFSKKMLGNPCNIKTKIIKFQFTSRCVNEAVMNQAVCIDNPIPHEDYSDFFFNEIISTFGNPQSKTKPPSFFQTHGSSNLEKSRAKCLHE